MQVSGPPTLDHARLVSFTKSSSINSVPPLSITEPPWHMLHLNYTLGLLKKQFSKMTDCYEDYTFILSITSPS